MLFQFSEFIFWTSLLKGSRYYENHGGRLPLTQKQFIEEIHDSGVLVYLSSTWLSELYKLIISCNILGESGYSTQDARVNNALVLMLTGENSQFFPFGDNSYQKIESSIRKSWKKVHFKNYPNFLFLLLLLQSHFIRTARLKPGFGVERWDFCP